MSLARSQCLSLFVAAVAFSVRDGSRSGSQRGRLAAVCSSLLRQLLLLSAQQTRKLEFGPAQRGSASYSFDHVEVVMAFKILA